MASPILLWFRRDLRLTDHPALNAAIRDSAGLIVPVFIQSDWHASDQPNQLHRWTGPARQEALCQSLAALASGLEALGSRLIIRRGMAVRELERLAHETRASAIYYSRDPDPFGRRTEEQLQQMAQSLGIRAVPFHDIAALPPDAVLTGQGAPFRVFTPYSKAWLRKEAAIPAPQARPKIPLQFPTPAQNLPSLPLPSLADWGLEPHPQLMPCGEPAARRRMKEFFDGPIYRYRELRDIPAAQQTSRFSVDLRWGTLSIRELIARCRSAADQAENATGRRSAFTFLNELIWREFYMAILWHWPFVLEHEFQPKFRGLPWLWPGRKTDSAALKASAVHPEEAFQRWKEGTTGFPIVDAGMRQLAATGFMHNRVRMIVAMFLTKDLHLDWRLGEQHFMQILADGEIASNNGGWQWSAGTGADAAPYFRIQNPWTQTAKFDPEGEYIKTWVPELRDLPASTFTRPPKPGLRLTAKYPLPIVDHAHERAITLEVFGLAPYTGA